jgi:hypothetical protein
MIFRGKFFITYRKTSPGKTSVELLTEKLPPEKLPLKKRMREIGLSGLYQEKT